MQRLRTAGLVVVLFALPASAWGACRDRDLAGTYDLRADSTSDRGIVTTTCEIGVTRNGTVRAGADCRHKTQDGVETEAKVDGGEIDISRRCRVTGQIVIDGYPSVITRARMTRDKERVTGAGTNSLDGSPVTFSATRQVAAVVAERPTRASLRRWWRRLWN